MAAALVQLSYAIGIANPLCWMLQEGVSDVVIATTSWVGNREETAKQLAYWAVALRSWLSLRDVPQMGRSWRATCS